MATEWGTIKLPKDLIRRLERLAIEADARHAAGRSRLPNEYANRCPLHFVISQALDEQERHRAAGRKGKKGGTRARA
jgi:uncharacterized membrane protein